MSFFVTLQSNFQHVMLYENPEMQEKARSCIPHQELSSAAERKLKEAKEADPGEVPLLAHKNGIVYLDRTVCKIKMFLLIRATN